MRTAVLAAALLGLATLPAFSAYEGIVDVLAGTKQLDEYWTPADSGREYGVLVSFAPERSRVWFAIDVLMASGSGDAVDPVDGPTHTHGSTVEYAFGVRKVWRKHVVRPELGAGALITTAKIERESASTSLSRQNNGAGFWVQAGVSFRLAKHVHLGLEGRYSRVQVDFGKDFDTLWVDAGGLHAGLRFGFDW